MIRWEDYFDGAVLRQGKDAEARGLVRNLQRLSDGSYTCTSVLPGGMRTPRVRVGDDENLKMSCSCPDFTGKGKCVHTASLCAAIEKKYPEAFGNVLFWSRDTLNDSRTDPFCEDHDTFFSVKDIFSGRYIITKSMVRIAEHMMAKGTAVHSSFNVGTGADGSPLLIGICTVSDGVRQVSVRLEAAPHALIHIACSDGTCSEFSTEGNGIICIHKLVMFLLASRYIRENNPAPRTNAAAEGMMKLLKKSRQLVIPDRIVRGRGTGNPIDIIPVLNYGMNELSFLVGKEKTYAVRSIAELMHCIKERLTLFYGKYLSMDFASDKLTERAGAVLSFIRTSGNAHGDRTLPITSENIGKFYELCRNVEVLDSEKRPLRAAEGECRLKYDFIAEKYHGKEGVITACISFPVRDSSGEYAYSSGNGEIRRMNVSSLGLLASIYPEKEPFTEKYVFGADSVGEFYMTVLPELEKHGDVDESAFSETGFWKEKRPVFSFFLDYAKAVVTAAVHVTYQTDDYILSPFEREPDDDRLPGEEEWVCRQVEVFLPVRRKGYWESVPRSDDQIYDFINQGIEAFRALGEVSVSDSLKRIIKKRPVKMKFGISLSDGLLDLKAVGDGLSPEEIVDILTSYRL
ncbi:MAG: SNF2 helicase associated domain-containing protein, partial [Bullifex sp.]